MSSHQEVQKLYLGDDLPVGEIIRRMWGRLAPWSVRMQIPTQSAGCSEAMSATGSD